MEDTIVKNRYEKRPQKKVVFIGDSLESGGAERVMSILANKLSDLDYSISIISKLRKEPFYKINENVNLLYPNNSINYNNVLVTLWGRIRTYKYIIKYLMSAKPDYVIPFLTTTAGVVVLICKILRLKVIACEHNNYKKDIKRLHIYFIKRYIYPLANHLNVLTKRDKEEFYGKFMSNVNVFPNPLSLKPVESVAIEKRDNAILAIGNLSRWQHKGFDNLLEIFAKILQSHPNWKLYIAGAGESNYLLTIISRLNISKQIVLLGEVKDISILMEQVKIFALTSRYEGFPMVLIEAMSQGLPCIAFDCFTGPGDIITDGYDGILVPDQDIDDFVSKLLVLINNSELQKRLGLNAANSSKKYSIEKIIKKWNELLES